ncbi:MAG: hypothetical protein ACTFAL_11865 [Candidatus Electronema sp. V4]|uniref:hypothetical protein n=1 Tax=Candidatus Electronema sp. V4 TaxID=3454756 RepID=UPI00405567FC
MLLLFAEIPACLSVFSGIFFADIVTPAAEVVENEENRPCSHRVPCMTDTEAYGDLYQWGREKDGHEKRTSGTTATLSALDNLGHGNFITSNITPYDWRSPQNNNLWQGVNGVNNPCPTGFRLPTKDEWQGKINSWISKNAAGAFASPLKISELHQVRSQEQMEL